MINLKVAAISIAITLTLVGCTTNTEQSPIVLPENNISTNNPANNQPETTETPEPAEETTPNPENSSQPNTSNPTAPELPEAEPLSITGVTTQKNITYTTAETLNGTIDLKLDLYAPVDENGNTRIENQPAVLLIHGGAFILGSKNLPHMEAWATELTKNGYVVANINYRLLLTEPKISNTALLNYLASADPTAALPAQAPAESIAALRIGLGAAIEDANAALTWLTDQGVNPTSIAIAGESAGAITALHLAYLNDTLNLNPVTPAAIINLYGAMSKPTNGGTEITPGEPPLWTLHGTNDIVVPYAAAEYLDEQTRNANIPHALHTATGKAHGVTAVEFFTGTTTSGTPYLNDQINFLQTHLVK